jgi:hypothetical protein
MITIEFTGEAMLFYLCMLATVGVIVKVYQVFVLEK